MSKTASQEFNSTEVRAAKVEHVEEGRNRKDLRSYGEKKEEKRRLKDKDNSFRTKLGNFP